MKQKIYKKEKDKQKNPDYDDYKRPLTPLDRINRQRAEQLDPLNPLLNGRLPEAWVGENKDVGKKSDREIFLDWRDQWVEMEKIIVANEERIREELRNKNKVDFADKYTDFSHGAYDVLGPEYREAYEWRQYVSALLGNQEKVLNWIEDRVVKGEQPDFDEIDSMGMKIVENEGNFATYVAPWIYAGLAAIGNVPGTGKGKQFFSRLRVRIRELWGRFKARGNSNISKINIEIESKKFDYLFGNASGRTHNIARSIQNFNQLKRIGIHNNAQGRSLLENHLKNVVRDQNNVLRTFSNEYGLFEVKESLFTGPGGSLKFESTWQVLPNGTFKFNTLIPKGGL